MAARSPAKKAGKAAAPPAKKATKASAPAKQAAVKSGAKSKSAAKAPSKSPVKGASKAVSKTPSKSTATPAKKPGKIAPAQQPTKTAAKAPAKKPPAQKQPAAKQPSKAPAKQPTKSPAKSVAVAPTPAPAPVDGTPKPKFNKEGIGYTKDFDLAFVKAQFDLLQKERAHLTGQAHRLEEEAHQLVEEAEMGDVQFDDEGGEGDTMVVERERDLALSAQARDAVAEIDAALERINAGTYGYSIISGRPIPKERLEAIPWSSVLVEEKVGGIGRR
jgi:RNA polymerase-binding transcription factor DksA